MSKMLLVFERLNDVSPFTQLNGGIRCSISRQTNSLKTLSMLPRSETMNRLSCALTHYLMSILYQLSSLIKTICARTLLVVRFILFRRSSLSHVDSIRSSFVHYVVTLWLSFFVRTLMNSCYTSIFMLVQFIMLNPLLLFRHMAPLSDAGMRRSSKACLVLYDWCNVIMKEFELHKSIKNKRST